MKNLLIALAVASTTGTATLATATQANAATRIQGNCGVTREYVIPPYLHRYRVHVGYSQAHPGHACTGIWRPLSGGIVPGSLAPWTPFGPQFDRWNWAGIADVTTTAGITATACMGFGAGMVGELPTAFSDTAITIGAAAGCVVGFKSLDHTVNNVFGINK